MRPGGIFIIYRSLYRRFYAYSSSSRLFVYWWEVYHKWGSEEKNTTKMLKRIPLGKKEHHKGLEGHKGN